MFCHCEEWSDDAIPGIPEIATAPLLAPRDDMVVS